MSFEFATRNKSQGGYKLSINLQERIGIDRSVLCDFIITGGNSTVFSDLVGKGIPVVRIIVNGDTYEEVKELKIDKYSDLKEWIDLYYSDIDRIKGIVKKNKAYFMPVEDVGGLYKAFFNRFN